MNRAVEKPERPAEDLDALLADFFRAELPSPWPAFRAPARGIAGPSPPDRPTALSPRSRRAVPAWTSRLALAAAAVLLLLAAWLLPGPATTAPGDRPAALPGLSDGAASGRNGRQKGDTPARARPLSSDKGKAAPDPRR